MKPGELNDPQGLEHAQNDGMETPGNSSDSTEQRDNTEEALQPEAETLKNSDENMDDRQENTGETEVPAETEPAIQNETSETEDTEVQKEEVILEEQENNVSESEKGEKTVEDKVRETKPETGKDSGEKKPVKKESRVEGKREKTDYTKLSQIELVNTLREVLESNGDRDIKGEVEAIKAAFYRLVKEEEEE
ncbi:MAG: hypothetical protein GX792_09010, partial [Bacteroidales bacterium]|nr:hypothetical protein [Bacteroidales bacterium]